MVTSPRSRSTSVQRSAHASPRPELPCGIYRHHDGGLYRVTGLSRNSTNNVPNPYGWLVGYVALDAEARGCPFGEGVYTRTIEEFTERVPWPDGAVRPRFTRDPEAEAEENDAEGAE